MTDQAPIAEILEILRFSNGQNFLSDESDENF